MYDIRVVYIDAIIMPALLANLARPKYRTHNLVGNRVALARNSTVIND